jgi:protein-S-isoprenylcysteine O-methyltransferase Ste14
MIWDITIRDEHKLCTVGAFSVVRHPSYAGSILALTGHTIFVLGSGTYVHECVGGSYPTAFRVVGGMIAAYVAVGIAGMVKRTAAEDELLKKTFEKEWVEWARRTRYRLIPGIF